MNIKIKGWEKLSGFTYKGFCIINPIHNAGETKYMADVLDLNQQHRPKWELNVLTPGHKWKAVNDDKFHILLWDDDRYSTRKEVDKNMILSVSSFRNVFENLVDELLQLRKKNSFTQPANVTPTINGNGATSGIKNVLNTAGTIVVYDSSTGTSFDLVDTIKTLQQQIEQLNKNINGGTK